MTNNTNLMTSLVKLKNSEYGSNMPPGSLKKLAWIIISVRKVQDPERDEAKARAKRIIADSIKDNLSPYVSSLKTPKGSVRFYEEEIEQE